MRRLLVVALLLLAGCDVFSGPEATDPLNEETLRKHLDYLAGDSLYGRGSGSEYELEAAEYVRDEFDEYGLAPGVAGWFQSFTYLTGPSLAPNSEQTNDIALVGSGWNGVRKTSAEGAAAVAQEEMATSQNVLGVVPGQGELAGQWVILGAHYDHIGFERISSDSIIIFNGADDNASGTSLMLEIARYLGHYLTEGVARSLDRRSLMFQAFGAEEAGLQGSRYFVSNPTMPLDSVTAMVNLDMVGRLRGGELYALGGSSSGLWEPLLTERNVDDLNVIIPVTTTGRSDHAPFYEARIPVLFFYTGGHGQYHQPDDDVWLLNVEGTIKIGDLAIAVLNDLLVRPDPPTFVR